MVARLRLAPIGVALLLAAGCGRPPAAQLRASYLSKNAAGQYESSGVSSMTTAGPPDKLTVGGSTAQIEIKVVDVLRDRAVLEVGGLNLGEQRVEVPLGGQAEVFLGNKDHGVRIEAQGK